MKHLKEERTVSGHLKALVELVILLSFFNPLNAQININNFCYLNSVTTAPNYKKIFLCDYSRDNIFDTILLNGKDKEVVEHKGTENYLPGEKSTKFFFYPISELQKLTYKENTGDLYVFVSRKERICGLLSFTKYGTLQLLSQISFDSYPEKIITADVDNNGQRKALLFGSNFDGLTILREKNFVLHKKEIMKDKVFSEAAFIDLDYDNILDIVVYDLFAGTLSFLYNDLGGSYSDYRQIQCPAEVKNLKVEDFDSDGYEDLVFQSDNQISFFMGDSVSSFERRRYLQNDEEIISYATADFNSDNLTDVAFIDKSGQLKITFALNQESFAEPVTYLQREGVVDLKVSRKGAKKSLIVLTEKGELITITNFIADPQKFSLSIGINVEALNYFDYSDSYHKDICFVDSFDGKLKMLVRGNAGGFDKLFQIPINYSFEKIVIPKKQKPKTTFYCYSPGAKLIERVEVDLLDGKYTKKKYYTYQKISDLKVEETNEGENLFALLYENKIAALTTFRFEGKSVTIEKTDTLLQGVEAPMLALGDPLGFYFWSRTDSTLGMYAMNLEDKPRISTLMESFVIDSFSQGRTIAKTYFAGNKNRDYPAGIAVTKRSGFAYVYDGRTLRKFRASNPKIFKTFTQNSFEMFRTFLGKFEYIFYYDIEGKDFYSADLRKQGKENFLSPLFENIYIDNYFVTDLYLKRINLVYVDRVKNCITIRRIE